MSLNFKALQNLFLPFSKRKTQVNFPSLKPQQFVSCWYQFITFNESEQYAIWKCKNENLWVVKIMWFSFFLSLSPAIKWMLDEVKWFDWCFSVSQIYKYVKQNGFSDSMTLIILTLSVIKSRKKLKKWFFRSGEFCI